MARLNKYFGDFVQILCKPKKQHHSLLNYDPSRLLKNYFQRPGRAVHGGTAHFSNTDVVEKWSKAKTALFALRAEKGHGRAFSASY